MLNHHKYFVNQRYRYKKERLFNEMRYGYNGHIWLSCLDSDKKEHYFHRPKKPYTILVHRRDTKDFHGYLKKYSNGCVRRSKELYQGNSYRKVFDLRWTED